MNYRIFVVDDNPTVRTSLARYLRRKEYEVEAFEDGPSALKSAQQSPPDMALVDIRLPGIDGLEVLRQIKRIHRDTVVVMITAYGSPESAVQALKAGAFEYISKPIRDLEALHCVIENGLEPVRLRKEIEALRRRQRETLRMPDVVAESAGMRLVLQQSALAAGNNECTVLITGQTGTGKELVAKLIHVRSDRFSAPFVVVNCGALPRELVESELFGYERGSFTGARSEGKAGRLESAHGGTILLDEIGEMPLQDQVKLLRFLETHEVQRIGSTQPKEVNVRVIAATNQPLEKMVEENQFRADLFYRLNAFRIHVPALEERKEDILPLANLFLYECNERFKKQVGRFTQDAVSKLHEYHWPGNVRELKNTIERAVLMAEADCVEGLHLVFFQAPESVHEEAASTAPLFALEDVLPLEEVENLYINKVLDKLEGNISRAARELRISRNRLRRKIEGGNGS